MPFLFHIKPIGDIQQGFELSCEAPVSFRAHHQRLIDAVIHATLAACSRPGVIQVHGCEGDIVDSFPLATSSVASFPDLQKQAA